MNNYIIFGVCILMLLISSIAFIRFADLRSSVSRENPNKKILNILIIFSLCSIFLFLAIIALALFNPANIFNF